MTNELVYWIWLSLHTGAGSELGSYLLRHFPTPRAVYEATESELRALDGIDDSIVSVLADRDLSLSERILDYCERVNVGIMTLDSALYPDRLRAIHAKPILLYYRGRVPKIDDNVMIACVGTRNCSDVGRANAKKLGHELAVGGAIVVSGMARGIDSAAQEAALEAGGHTIAVLGCGIDRVYPPENKELMRRIAEKGTILTEYAPGTEPAGKNFPIRNRIISGLCQATVVVEADEYSGSLITARHAISQGREVFAFPGNAGDPHFSGTNMLIKEGAKLVTAAYDILAEYEMLYPHRIFTENISLDRTKHYRSRYPKDEKKEQKPTHDVMERFMRGKIRQTEEKPIPEAPKKEKRTPDFSHLGDTEQKILSCIDDTIPAEEIARRLKEKYGVTVDMGTLLGMLTMFELDGLLAALPGGSFRPTWKD